MTVKVPAQSVPQSLHRLGPRGSWISQQCSLVLIPWFGDRVLSLRGTVRELQRSSSAASFSQQDQPSRTPLLEHPFARSSVGRARARNLWTITSSTSGSWPSLARKRTFKVLSVRTCVEKLLPVYGLSPRGDLPQLHVLGVREHFAHVVARAET